MARRHGWHLPFHTFQVVAITVFFLLVVAFYAFFAPFLGSAVLEYATIGVYTLVALLVFVLYVRCTAIDPADPGILISPDERLAGLIWLLVESGVGIAVFVRCFVEKKGMENQIIDRLGNGFSRYPFSIIVAICTFVSLLACVQLGELFFFHMILIRKGITTYEYVIAMRAQSEPAGPSVDGDHQSVPTSPTGSALTGLSRGSSLGLQYKGAWCTPPRVFVDQDEIVPHLGPGRVPSTTDPDVAGFTDKGKRIPKRQVKISAWKLAKLDSNEAIKAAARARASSSVFQPTRSRYHPDSGYCSSDNASGLSSVSTDLDLHKNGKHSLRLAWKHSYPPSRASRDDIEPGTRSVSSCSSPTHTSNSVALSSSPLNLHVGRLMSNVEHFNPIYQTSMNESMCPNGTNETHESIATRHLDELSGREHGDSNARDRARPSVVWDSDTGRYVSVLLSGAATDPLGGTLSNKCILRLIEREPCLHRAFDFLRRSNPDGLCSGTF